jgi:hypothetical protein
MSKELICNSCEELLKQNSQLIRKNSYLNSELMRFKLLFNYYEKYINFLEQNRNKKSLNNKKLVTKGIELNDELIKYKSIKSFEIKANIVSENNSNNNNNNNEIKSNKRIKRCDSRKSRKTNNNRNEGNDKTVEHKVRRSPRLENNPFISYIEFEFRNDSSNESEGQVIDNSYVSTEDSVNQNQSIDSSFEPIVPTLERVGNENESQNVLSLDPIEGQLLKRKRAKKTKIENDLIEEKILSNEMMKRQMKDTFDITMTLDSVQNSMNPKNGIEELLSSPQITIQPKCLRRYYSCHLITNRIESEKEFNENNFDMDFEIPFNLIERKVSKNNQLMESQNINKEKESVCLSDTDIIAEKYSKLSIDNTREEHNYSNKQISKIGNKTYHQIKLIFIINFQLFVFEFISQNSKSFATL